LSKNASYLADDEVITSEIVRLGGLNSVARFKHRLRILGTNIPWITNLPLYSNLHYHGRWSKKFSIGNRIAVQPRADDFGSVYSIPTTFKGFARSGTTLGI
jgi:hypothetical protein